jgi:hypothetical protein
MAVRVICTARRPRRRTLEMNCRGDLSCAFQDCVRHSAEQPMYQGGGGETAELARRDASAFGGDRARRRDDGIKRVNSTDFLRSEPSEFTRAKTGVGAFGR